MKGSCDKRSAEVSTSLSENAIFERMQDPKTYLRILRNNLMLIVLLFALSPCSVKQSIHQFFDQTYTKPLNKSKVVLSGSEHCSDANVQVFAKEVKGKTTAFIPVAASIGFNPLIKFPLENSRLKALHSGTHYSLNLPPKYILFKRLKIAGA